MDVLKKITGKTIVFISLTLSLSVGIFSLSPLTYADTVFTHALVQGNSGSDIATLQQILVDQGYLSSDSVSGYFGPATAAALQQFQTAHGIDPLGGVGPRTRDVLNGLASTPSIPATPPAQTSQVNAPVTNGSVTFTESMTIGAQDTQVLSLQQLLVSLGFLNTDPTGYFGPATFAAVKAFQTAHGLEAVGSVGPQTRAALNAAGGTATTPTQTNQCTQVTLTRALDVGAKGSDVTALQTFLNAQGLLNTEPTGFYGTLTSAAVKQLQANNNLEPIGGVGPKTRALIATLSQVCTTAPTTTPTAPTKRPPSR